MGCKARGWGGLGVEFLAKNRLGAHTSSFVCYDFILITKK
jgi:hypothetical protein